MLCCLIPSRLPALVLVAPLRNIPTWEQELFDVYEAPESIEKHRGEPVSAGYSLARTKVPMAPNQNASSNAAGCENICSCVLA